MKTESSAPARVEVVTEVCTAMRLMPLDSLIGFVALASALTRDGCIVTAASTHRIIQRYRWLRRFGELRVSPDWAGKSDDDLFRRVAAEVKHADPDAKISARSMRRWVTRFNTIAPDGLAFGWRAIEDYYSCGQRSTPKRKRKRRRSPR